MTEAIPTPATKIPAGASPRTAARNVGQLSAAVVSGLALATAGVVILMGIITAEALYPGTYTTHDNEISDLGATKPPDSIIRQPSARIFNATMILSGALIIVAALGLRRAKNARRVWLSVLVIGIAVFGVGIFPGNRAPMHGIFALLAFTSGGVGAILSARAQARLSGWASMVLGAITLAVLLFAVVGSGTALFDRFGDGGVERWVAYPVILWLVLFGGHLMAEARTASLVAGPASA